MWFNCTKTALKKLNVAYNNSLRRFMGLPWHNSASEMFANLNIKSFGEMLFFYVGGRYCHQTSSLFAIITKHIHHRQTTKKGKTEKDKNYTEKYRRKESSLYQRK